MLLSYRDYVGTAYILLHTLSVILETHTLIRAIISRVFTCKRLEDLEQCEHVEDLNTEEKMQYPTPKLIHTLTEYKTNVHRAGPFILADIVSIF